MTTTTRLEKVTTGQRIRRPGWAEFRTVASHTAGILHGIQITFPDGSSLTALPSTPVEVQS